MDVPGLRQKLTRLVVHLDERSRRLVLAAEPQALGRGGIEAVHRVSGAARSTIAYGIRELDEPPPQGSPPIRRPGAGRKRTVTKDPTLRSDLLALVAPHTRGDPESPLRWTSKCLRHLAEELRHRVHPVSYWLARELLKGAGYHLQENRKTKEGSHSADRDVQFSYINDHALAQQRAGQPVISIGTKKEVVVGDFANVGREWMPQERPERVRVHDFLIPENGKAIPYGVYDLQRNEGWVSLGIDHDTASFAVRAIQRWRQRMGGLGTPEPRP